MKTCPQCHKNYDDMFQICPDDDTALVNFTGQFDTDPLIGKMFAGRFQIMEKIGQGGMGAIYKAVHTRMDRTCAIKLLTALSSDNQAALARFNREARMASRIDHPHAVIIYDFGESESGIPYLAMEFIDGKPLSHLMAKEKTLPIDRVVHITDQIAEALSAAHALGIVHRDLKPDNIMLTRKGADPDYVKVLDFGIAKTITDEEADSLTKTGFVLGTPLYMSPEQLSGDKLDGRSDVYSLAIIVYEMLSGQLPFEGDNTQAMMIKRVIGNPIPLRQKAPHVSAEVEQVVMHGLAREHDERASSALEFASSLRKACHVQPVQGKPTNALSQGGSRDTVEYASDSGEGATDSQPQGTMVFSSASGAEAKIPQPPQGGSATVPYEAMPTAWEQKQDDTDDNQSEVTYSEGTDRQTRSEVQVEVPTERAIPKVKQPMPPVTPQTRDVVKTVERRISPVVWAGSAVAVVAVVALIYFLLPLGKTGFTLTIKGAPPGSEVFIASVKRGVIGADGTLTLTANEGNAQVRVAREGYADFDASVAGARGEERTIEARLLPLEMDYRGEMVLIPAGEFTMGDNNGPDDAKPAHTVDLKAFYIDRYEVTNAEYKKFCQDTDHKPPANPEWDQNYFEAHPDSPVLGVTRQEAIEYAQWAGKRLPKEEEWEKAASWDPVTKTKRIWPWGNEPEKGRANLAPDPPDVGHPESVKHQTSDRSAYGVLGMAGNVWEWVDGFYEPYPGNNASNPDFGKKLLSMRGGNFQNKDMNQAKTTFRNYLPAVFPKGMTTPIGFRCAISADNPDLQEHLSKVGK
ncbi:MAG TPA: bifunctional serine/threonine-protein kinase/formylglycine-generating enzyme family protein [Blastocatellia bacterium]